MKLYNLKRNPFNQEWEPKLSYSILQIPSSSPYICNLPLIPKKVEESPSECKFLFGGASLTETSSEPSPGEFRIDYLSESDADVYEGSGQVLFNSSNAGEYVILAYQAVGSINLAKNITEKRELPYLRSILYQVNEYVTEYHPRGGYIDKNQALLLRSTGVYRTNFNIAVNDTELYSTFPIVYSETHRLISGYYEGRLLIFCMDGSLDSYSYYSDDILTTDSITFTDFPIPDDFTRSSVLCAAFVQIGSFIYVFAEEKALVIDIASLSIKEITATPLAWQWGTAIYGNDGFIYLLGNLESDNIGKCYKYNIFEDSYEELFTLDSSTYYINGGVEADGYLHFLEQVSTTQIAHILYDIENNQLYRYYSNINDNEYGGSYAASLYQFNNLFKSSNGEALLCWDIYSATCTSTSGTTCSSYTYSVNWLLQPLEKYKVF